MKIYIDPDSFKCYAINRGGAYLEAETDFFDNKCKEFIEGYRFIPEGESWTRSDGVVFYGKTIAPWKDYRELDSIQRDYERNMYLESLEKDTAYMDAYAEGVQGA